MNQQRDKDCPICLQNTNKTTTTNSCTHSYCYTCISRWAENKKICPVCQRPFQRLVLCHINSKTKKQHKRTKRNITIQAPSLNIQEQDCDSSERMQAELFSALQGSKTRHSQNRLLTWLATLHNLLNQE